MNETQQDIFENRNIYSYHDGSKDRLADPIPTMLALFEACDIEAEQAVINTLGPKAERDEATHQDGIALLKAQNEIAKAARKAFGLKKLGQRGDKVTGMTDGEAIGIALDFLDWMSEVKKKLST